MKIKVLSKFIFEDILVRYVMDEDTLAVGLSILPAHMENEIVEHRQTLKGTLEADNIADVEFPAWNIDSMVQVKCLGDNYPAFFSQGRTMRNSSSVESLRYREQKITQTDESKSVITIFDSNRGFECEHVLTHRKGFKSLETETIFRNYSDKAITLEMLTSFSLGFITPFDSADAAERICIHRIQSSWSAEGRLETRTLEDMHLERSWSGYSAVSHRFGQVGSMPVREFFPFIAVEDIKTNVIWAAQLACASSWQMELYRRDDFVCISGGLADREFGQWMKNIKPNEAFKTPKAILTVCQESLDVCCQRLTKSNEISIKAKPQIESDLPIIFNEWCTTWGNPTHESIVALADKIKDTGIKYLVIDAGWYRKKGVKGGSTHGDWIADNYHFPDGIEATAKAIRDRGLIPGLWFEMETVNPDSDAYSQTQHFLKRDGCILNSGQRRFWNFCDPWVIDYLNERVIGLLKKCGFGYIKVDYNETIGIGVDGSDSLGENLRQHIQAVQLFF